LNDQAARLRLLVDSLQKRIRSQILETPVGCRVIVITSGKGGVGKTNLVLGLAIALAKANYRVLLWDADLGMANVDVILGLIPKYNLSHVLRDERSIQETIVEGPVGLQIIPGGSGIEELANVEPFILRRLFQEIAVLDKKLDYLFIDTSAGISKQVLAVALAATEVLLVTTPEPTALTDAYGMIKVLKSYNGADKIKLIVNMTKDNREGETIAKKLLCVTKQFLNLDLAVLGYVPYDRAVQNAVRNNQSYYLAYPRAAASFNTLKIASSLGKIEQKKPGGLKAFIEQTISFFS